MAVPHDLDPCERLDFSEALFGEAQAAQDLNGALEAALEFERGAGELILAELQQQGLTDDEIDQIIAGGDLKPFASESLTAIATRLDSLGGLAEIALRRIAWGPRPDLDL